MPALPSKRPSGPPPKQLSRYSIYWDSRLLAVRPLVEWLGGGQSYTHAIISLNKPHFLAVPKSTDNINFSYIDKQKQNEKKVKKIVLKKNLSK